MVSMKCYFVITFAVVWLCSYLPTIQSATSLGGYSLYPPIINPKFDKELDNLVQLQKHDKQGKKKTKEHEKEEEVDELDIDFSHIESMADMEPILKRVFLDSESLIEKYRRLLVRRGVTVVSLPHWLFGWRSYCLLSDIGVDGDECIEVELSSPPNSSTGDIRMKFSFRMNDSGAVDMTTKCSSRGAITGEVTDRLHETIRSHTKKALKTEMLVLNARRKMINAQHKQSAKVRSKKKKLELDMIINPDKYKTRSGTVKNPKDVGKNSQYARSESARDRPEAGRYTPSTATQSRRVVTRSR